MRYEKFHQIFYLNLNIIFTDPCLTEKMIGDCRAAITRFFFDKESSSCVSFNYGGSYS